MQQTSSFETTSSSSYENSILTHEELLEAYLRSSRGLKVKVNSLESTGKDGNKFESLVQPKRLS